MTKRNDRIFVSTSYMSESAVVAWAACDAGILSPDDRDSFTGELMVHLDGRATVKFWDGPANDERSFVVVIDPARADGSYLTIYETEDQPPDANWPVCWRSSGIDARTTLFDPKYLETLLRNAELDQDEPIGYSDDELLRLAGAAAEELRRRMPRYALELGDLPDWQEPVVEAAEETVAAIATLRSVWEA